MIQNRIYIFLVLFVLSGCIKDDLHLNCEEDNSYDPFEDKSEPYEKFLGDYKVYDTLFNYKYNMSIAHFSGVNQYGVTMDSLRLTNFADSFNFDIRFNPKLNVNLLDLTSKDTLFAHSNNRFFFWSNSDDLSTPNIIENELLNDTILFYYTLDNIKYYLWENVPYYQCNCKEYAIKQ